MEGTKGTKDFMEKLAGFISSTEDQTLIPRKLCASYREFLGSVEEKDDFPGLDLALKPFYSLVNSIEDFINSNDLGSAACLSMFFQMMVKNPDNTPKLVTAALLPILIRGGR